MKKCAYCGSAILFGGVEVDGKWYEVDCKRKMQERQHYADSGRNYRAAIERLKTSPLDPGLREKALETGRLHASWGRHLQGTTGVTVFDEVALANDIQAACAGAGAAPAESTTLEARLEKLGSLLSRGLISEAEHRERRQQILAEI